MNSLLLDAGTRIISGTTPVIESGLSTTDGAGVTTTVTQQNGRTELLLVATADAQRTGAIWAPGWDVGSNSTGTWDLSSDDRIGFDFGFPAASQYYSYLQVVVKFDASAGTYNNYALGPAFDLANFAREREFRVFLKSDFTVTGAADWSAVTSIELWLFHVSGNIGGTNEVYMHGVYHGVEMQPVVVLSFDDGHVSIIDEAFRGDSNGVGMSSLGLPGTLYLNSDNIGSVPGTWMEWADVQTLYDAGWDYANQQDVDTAMANPVTLTSSGTTGSAETVFAHGLNTNDFAIISGAWPAEYNGVFQVTVSDPTHFTFTMTDVGDVAAVGASYVAVPLATYQDGINANTQEGIDRSLTRALGHVAYSYGAVDNTAIDLYLSDSQYWTRPILSGAMTISGVSPFRGLDYFWHKHDDRSIYKMWRVDAGALSASAETLLGYVDDAIERGAVIHIYFHTFVDTPTLTTEYSLAEFKALIEGLATRIAAGSIVAKTISQLYAMAANSRLGLLGTRTTAADRPAAANRPLAER